MSDSALERIAADRYDVDAWRAIYDRLRPRAMAIAYRMLGGDESTAQDVVHDSFISLFRDDEACIRKSADELTKFFTVVVKHRAIDALRSRKLHDARVVHLSYEDDDSPPDILDEGADPARRLMLTQRIIGLTQHLNSREETIATMLVEGHSAQAIAAELGITEQAAAVAVHRLRAKLDRLETEDRAHM